MPSGNPNIPEVRRVHGHYGELWIKGSPVAECTGIEYTVEVEQIEVPQVGGYWQNYVEGTTRGTGTLHLAKAYSSFEKLFMDYVNKSVQELRTLRNAGTLVRPTFTLTVVLDDPMSYGKESDILTGVKFWNYSAGFGLTDLVNRDWPFTFRGISQSSSIANSPSYLPDLS